MIHFKKFKKNIIKIIVNIYHSIILQTNFKYSKINHVEILLIKNRKFLFQFLNNK